MPSRSSIGRNQPGSRRHWLPNLTNPLAVIAGGLVGSALRAGIGALWPAARGAFPVGILVVNLSGSFLLGWYLVRRESAVTTPWSMPFWAFGLLGSFTTFSAFTMEVTLLLADGKAMAAAGYIGASTVGGLIAALLGQRIATVIR
jgi:CrcB protein